MNFLILSNDYCGNVVYKRLVEEKHNAWLINPYGSRNGISTISSIHVALNNHLDCAIITSTGFAKEARIISDKGIKIFGVLELQERLQLNTEISQKLLKKYNVRLLKDSTEVLLPLTVYLLFSNGCPLYQYIAAIKQTKFLTGDLGCDVIEGESVVLFSYPNRDVEVVKRIFDNGLFDALKAIKYTGVFSVDTFISKDDKYPYVSRLTTKLEACVLTALLELLPSNFGDIVYKIANKEEPSILLRDEIACAVSISVPPWPYNQAGFVTYLCSSGVDWLDARRNVGRKIKDLNLKNIQYRTDAGYQGEHIETLKRINYFNN